MPSVKTHTHDDPGHPLSDRKPTQTFWPAAILFLCYLLASAGAYYGGITPNFDLTFPGRVRRYYHIELDTRCLLIPAAIFGLLCTVVLLGQWVTRKRLVPHQVICYLIATVLTVLAGLNILHLFSES